MKEMNNLVERLSLQAESFQEGFEILSKASGLKELVSNFARLLKGNFIVKDLFFFHKASNNSEWKNAGLNNKTNTPDLTYLKDCNNLNITYYDKQKYTVSIVLPLSDSSLIGILIGQKLDGTVFNDFDKITLQILLQVFNSAHKSFLNQKKEKELIFGLNEKIFQLNHLIDAGIELSRFEKRNILFELALERVSSLTNSTSALIKIVNKQDGKEQHFLFPAGHNRESILNSEFKIQSSFEHRDRSYNFVLSGKETRKGLTSFNDLDRSLFEAVTRQVSAAIENEFLHQQSVEKELIEKEINIAASIQQRIIPIELAKIEGYEIAGINIPSKEVGGDYYDCINLSNGKVALVIADVTGKGIAAALLVNTLNASLYSYLEFDLPLTEIAARLNKLIYRSTPSDRFITFFIAVLDPGKGELEVLNAGHNPILLLRENGTLEKIDAGGIGLGMLDFGIPYTGQSLKLEKGDKLFLYTDGIPEAMNPDEEEYSDDRMFNFFKNNSGLSSEEFIDAIVKDVKEHVGTANQSDDITCLILERI
ncbi:MAG: PP2C family protein-serine/threonine phosphatase [Ignavibacteriaceae bacterium]